MNDNDYEAFQREFARLAAAMQSYKISPAELQSKTDAYFHALKRLPFSIVVKKADHWLATETKFPKPVEWANTIVPADVVPLEKMTDHESAQHHEAEQLGSEREPCGCPSCVENGVHEKPQRYVPLEDANGNVVKKINRFERIVTAGQWIHGRELARWYEARGNFWNRCYELGLMDGAAKQKADKRPLLDVINDIFKKKSERREGA